MKNEYQALYNECRALRDWEIMDYLNDMLEDSGLDTYEFIKTTRKNLKDNIVACEALMETVTPCTDEKELEMCLMSVALITTYLGNGKWVGKHKYIEKMDLPKDILATNNIFFESLKVWDCIFEAWRDSMELLELSLEEDLGEDFLEAVNEKFEECEDMLADDALDEDDIDSMAEDLTEIAETIIGGLKVIRKNFKILKNYLKENC